jgi:hypothetical protein
LKADPYRRPQWSGYACRPAARLTRSASLLMTLSDLRLCIAASENLFV